MILKFRRFGRRQVLRRIGRDLLDRFLQQFQPQLQLQGVALPAKDVSDETYFNQVANWLAAPEKLPVALTEALFAIEEMATGHGQEQLEAAAAKLNLELRPDSTREDLAVQVWLADPRALARLHNQQRLRRLTTFEHFGSPLAAAARSAFNPPDNATLQRLQAELDPWFARHHRGRDTTRLELYPPATSAEAVAADDYWFVIRHGDTFVRTAKVEAQQTEILHYRPERDDVVVYSATHDELRINCRTKGERALYVRTFGQCLRGAADYFSRAWTYTLEPLRLDGPAALATDGLEGIHKIVLRELEVAWENPLEGRIVRAADDLFGTLTQLDELVPARGRLARAAFDVSFAGAARPRMVELRPPNVLKLARHCDARRVDGWLCRRGFRVEVD